MNNHVKEMNYYHCSYCNKRIELKYKKAHLRLELHKNTEGTIVNNYANMTPELYEINNLIKKKVINYDKRFEF